VINVAAKTRARKAPAKRTRKPDPMKHDGEALLARSFIKDGQMFLRPEETDAPTEDD
jgi:hypothetical protein